MGSLNRICFSTLNSTDRTRNAANPAATVVGERLAKANASSEVIELPMLTLPSQEKQSRLRGEEEQSGQPLVFIGRRLAYGEHTTRSRAQRYGSTCRLRLTGRNDGEATSPGRIHGSIRASRVMPPSLSLLAMPECAHPTRIMFHGQPKATFHGTTQRGNSAA